MAGPCKVHMIFPRSRMSVSVALRASTFERVRVVITAPTAFVLHLQDFLLQGGERVHQARVEVAAGLRREMLEGLLARPGLLVGPHRGERVVHVGHRDDARAQRNMVADQPVGIAGAVLVVFGLSVLHSAQRHKTLGGTSDF